MSIRTRSCAAVLAALLAAAALAGCGDDGSEPAASSTTLSSPSPSAVPTQDEAAAEAEIRTAWESFFDGSVPPEQKPALLERGEELGEALALAAQDPNSGAAAAQVQSVILLSETEAAVTYDILSGGSVVLTGAQGKAVLDGDSWKVSAQTFCQLTALSSGQPQVPGCT
jgi:hypothetical protein